MTAHCSKPKNFPDFPTQSELGEAAFSLGYLEGSIRGIYDQFDFLSKTELKELLRVIPTDLTKALAKRRENAEKIKGSML